MAAAESARPSTVHEHVEDSDAHVRASPGPARDTLPNQARSATDLTERSRRLIEERWGKRIEEPSPEPEREPGAPLRVADGLNQLHYWRDQPPSLRAVWLDMKEGGVQVFDEQGMAIAGLYWAMGVPCLAWVCVLRVAESPAYRPGRAYGALVLVVLVWIALAIAGLNPVSFSDLNPF